MKRITILLASILVALNLLATNGNGHFHKSFRNQQVLVDDIEQQFSHWFSLPVGTEWREVGRNTDQLGMTRIEYRQYLSGIEVEHSQILLHVKDGRVLTANGTVMESTLMPPSADRYNKAPSYYSPQAFEGTLLIVDTPEGYRYATKKLSVKGEWEYRDIHTGELIKSVPSTWHFSPDDDTPTSVKASGIFCGDVSINVSQLGDGSYTLYDATRNIYTINAAYIKSINQLSEENRLAEFFPAELIPNETTYENLRQMKSALLDKKYDLTKYLLSAGTLNSHNGELTTYRLTGMTIDRLLAADESQTVYDMMPASKSPTVLRITMRYADTDGALFDYINSFTQPSTTIQFSDIEEAYRLLPSEGVTVTFCAVRPKGEFDPTSENMETISRNYTISFVPDESGMTTIDREDIKVTFTYEKTGNPAVDIHYNIAKALDYYKIVHQREGYDGNNAPAYNIVFQPTTDNVFNLMPPQEDEPMGAIEGRPNDEFGDPNEPPLYVFEMTNFNAGAVNGYTPVFMAYGLGGKLWSRNCYMRPVIDKSVIFHEFTHLVTYTSANLVYKNESGALNEAFSDIMAISMMKSPDYGIGPDAPWIIGEHTMSGFSCLRNLADPKNSLDGKNPCPDTYEGEYWVDGKDPDVDDHGGVHTNSGVMNKFYYLLCDGGSGTNDKGFAYNVTGIGVEKAEKIAFRTLVQYATESSDYSDIRKCFIEAATDLYGTEEVEAVKSAWAAVNVNENGDTPSSLAPPVSTLNTQTTSHNTIYDLQGRPVVAGSKGVYIVNGKKVVLKP